MNLPVAPITRGKLHCPKCGQCDTPNLMEYGYSIRHRLHTINRKEISASGGDSSDFSESGDDFRLECPRCYAEFALPKGMEIDWL